MLNCYSNIFHWNIVPTSIPWSLIVNQFDIDVIFICVERVKKCLYISLDMVYIYRWMFDIRSSRWNYAQSYFWNRKSCTSEIGISLTRCGRVGEFRKAWMYDCILCTCRMKLLWILYQCGDSNFKQTQELKPKLKICTF